ncbi:TPA: hypothetical protein DHW62_01790 [candidate division WWE3 bacterium]|uniref:Uncharacterized protein n=1 Tax=candidate division WWE3 bacterium TaxID=2053526 RepID=A0A656PM50_UNCKA|nr:MAG: hypothetical protein A2364_01900 [candidate division WWE3 bacterium RIFOXYB1_FULL_43_12]HAI95578.1 hypothetical protein [candidate division WWE3 bacterium]HBL00624.1 hypothetical protein [candidate division WWE3 bacterium]HCE36664.1 hypothetical protein [candidate division WWE3 bacterium]HCL95638.1 hypothetical protein [candidate division WWE3 bacterium]
MHCIKYRVRCFFTAGRKDGNTVYEFWVELTGQGTKSEVQSTYKRIELWGAAPTRSTNLTNLQYAFKSSKNPTRLLGELSKEGVILNWGFFSKTQLAKPKRKPINTPGTDKKAEKFKELKNRFGKKLSGKT